MCVYIFSIKLLLNITNDFYYLSKNHTFLISLKNMKQAAAELFSMLIIIRNVLEQQIIILE